MFLIPGQYKVELIPNNLNPEFASYWLSWRQWTLYQWNSLGLKIHVIENIDAGACGL